jgi:hypothetical protein
MANRLRISLPTPRVVFWDYQTRWWRPGLCIARIRRPYIDYSQSRCGHRWCGPSWWRLRRRSVFRSESAADHLKWRNRSSATAARHKMACCRGMRAPSDRSRSCCRRHHWPPLDPAPWRDQPSRAEGRHICLSGSRSRCRAGRARWRRGRRSSASRPTRCWRSLSSLRTG